MASMDYWASAEWHFTHWGKDLRRAGRRTPISVGAQRGRSHVPCFFPNTARPRAVPIDLFVETPVGL